MTFKDWNPAMYAEIESYGVPALDVLLYSVSADGYRSRASREFVAWPSEMPKQLRDRVADEVFTYNLNVDSKIGEPMTRENMLAWLAEINIEAEKIADRPRKKFDELGWDQPAWLTAPPSTLGRSDQGRVEEIMQKLREGGAQ